MQSEAHALVLHCHDGRKDFYPVVFDFDSTEQALSFTVAGEDFYTGVPYSSISAWNCKGLGLVERPAAVVTIEERGA